nr:putative ribonuclease H [Ipomoea batatas]
MVVGMNTGHPVDEVVRWTVPPSGWIKINVDGSCTQSTGAAACGGLSQDHQGRWLRGFMHNIGCCSIEEAEAWGVIQGLYVALQLGVRNIMVESDSKDKIDSCCGLRRLQGNKGNIINRCTEMAKRFTNITFCHVFREQNRSADYLAKQVLS